MPAIDRSLLCSYLAKFRPIERPVAVFCIQNDEFCIQNDELCIQNDEFCIQKDELFAFKMMMIKIVQKTT